MKKKQTNPGFFTQLFHKDSEEIRMLKQVKKKIRKIKTIPDLEALEEELIAIGVLDPAELEKRKKAKRKKRKSEKEIFEERVRCNLEIINRTILVGKQFKEEQKMRKDEVRFQDKEERNISSGGKSRERDEKIR